ncbi:hypothetical protein DHEL01_v205406 [Diaporthe helianthi]|uniref:Uncharacterized protein n=1 Tax=Diaporthe helianthi TaxID=158607 RepID=A0A2P5I141_DIAHE|nr:hypothetical protein DHEL01_v205406 [Diaporthe helianthi]
MDTWIPSCLVLPQRLCPMPTITSLPGVDPFPLRYRRRANATIYAVSPLRTQSSIQTSIGFEEEDEDEEDEGQSVLPLGDDDIIQAAGPTGTTRAAHSLDDIIEGSKKGGRLPEQPSRERTSNDGDSVYSVSRRASKRVRRVRIGQGRQM